MLTIRVEKKHHEGYWIASYPEMGSDSPTGGGDSIAHAVGNLILKDRSSLGISLEMIDRPGGQHETIGPGESSRFLAPNAPHPTPIILRNQSSEDSPDGGSA